MSTFELASKIIDMKSKNKYNFSKRHWFQLSIGIFMIIIGILMAIRSVNNSHTILSFLGALFVATGTQISLWTLGVRSEFLGTNYENTALLEQGLPNKGISKDIVELAELVHYLAKLLNNHYQNRHNLGETSKRTDLIIKEAISLAKSTTPQFSIVFLTAQLEEQFEYTKYNSARNHGDLSINSLERRHKAELMFYDAYRSMSQIRDAIIHERIPVSQADIMSLVDLGIRLMKLSEYINNAWHN